MYTLNHPAADFGEAYSADDHLQTFQIDTDSTTYTASGYIHRDCLADSVSQKHSRQPRPTLLGKQSVPRHLVSVDYVPAICNMAWHQRKILVHRAWNKTAHFASTSQQGS